MVNRAFSESILASIRIGMWGVTGKRPKAREIVRWRHGNP